jgi:3-oxoacyl-[acyl-carrier protein] reductase
MSDQARPLAGRSILVTGASGGIGAALVTRLAQEGARPLIRYGRNRAAAQALLDRIGGAGWIVPGDLSDPHGPAALWKRALALAGRIDGLVNNAGIRAEIGRRLWRALRLRAKARRAASRPSRRSGLPRRSAAATAR